MRRFLVFSGILTSFVLAGCQQSQSREFLVVGFRPDSTLRYSFVSERTVEINLSKDDKAGGKPSLLSERLDMVIAYHPVEINEFGLSTIEATCESAKVKRTESGSRKKQGPDPMEKLAGKSFRFKISPSGKIAESSEFEALVKEIGKGALRPGKGSTRIKEMDMIYDLISMQWHLWDSVSEIKNPRSGVKSGQSWQAHQIIALPMLSRPVKEATYTLEEIVQESADSDRKAIITSSYAPSDQFKGDWPDPYSGRARMGGIMGFLRNYRVLSLEGSGKQVFNINRGMIEDDQMEYHIKMSAAMAWPLPGTDPQVNVDQKMSIKLLEN